MPLLFVYGTLKRGCKNHRHLSDQRFTANARTTAGYRLYDLGDYPGLVADTDTENESENDNAGVTGELWEVDAAALARLDAFEGVPEGLYRRESILLQPPHDTLPVESYFYARPLLGARALGPTWIENR